MDSNIIDDNNHYGFGDADMLTLYHGKGSLASQKVRLALAEKGLVWESHVVSADARRGSDYLKINRNALVPSLEHDGRIIIESRVINEYLDDAFPDPPLMPPDPFGRARVHAWTAQDDQLHINVFTLSFLQLAHRELLPFPPEEWPVRAPGLTDAVKRERSIDVARHGFDSPYLAEGIRRFRVLFRDMETVLNEKPWLGGDVYSLAETDLTPYLCRLQSMGLGALWDGHRHVQSWYERVQARPSFKAAILDWIDLSESARWAETVRTQLDRLLAKG